MRVVSNQCPVCGEKMHIVRLECSSCHTAVEGEFSVVTDTPISTHHIFPQLTFDQTEFIKVFLKCRGIIKNVEHTLGVSYPTVKARLNDVIKSLGYHQEAKEEDIPILTRREILADLADGKLSADEALDMLKQIS